ncbi:MAG: GtrA family protein [Bacilli bacterium]|nr:GtrA family protein [Bacilli bacterium]
MEEEKTQQEKKESFLDKIDNKADKKGIKTLWQAIKFLVVSCLVTLIQLGLVNLMYFLMKGWTTPLPGFLAIIFSEQTIGVGHSNWGYILPFFISNLVANTVGYFLNKSKTFKSDAPWWHYVIYILVLLVLISISTWLQGLIVNGLNSVGAEVVAPTIAGMAAGMFQLIALFPLQKYVLLKEKKEEKTPSEK